MFTVKLFLFDCNGLFGFDIYGEMNFAKRARVDFVIQMEPVPNNHCYFRYNFIELLIQKFKIQNNIFMYLSSKFK